MRTSSVPVSYTHLDVYKRQDYHCEAFVNGVSVGTHTGGYVSFCVDVTEAVHEGENVITVYAEDDERDPLIPRGKQSELFYSCLLSTSSTRSALATPRRRSSRWAVMPISEGCWAAGTKTAPTRSNGR